MEEVAVAGQDVVLFRQFPRHWLKICQAAWALGEHQASKRGRNLSLSLAGLAALAGGMNNDACDCIPVREILLLPLRRPFQDSVAGFRVFQDSSRPRVQDLSGFRLKTRCRICQHISGSFRIVQGSSSVHAPDLSGFRIKIQYISTYFKIFPDSSKIRLQYLFKLPDLSLSKSFDILISRF